MANGYGESIKPNDRKNLAGERIRAARQEFPGGLTQDQLSGKLAALGVSLDRAAVAKIELGMRHIYDFELLAFADVLKVKVSWLLSPQS